MQNKKKKIKNLPLNQVLIGNSLELLKQIPDNSIDLIFADPPYWMRVDGTLKRPEGGDFSGCYDVWDNQFENLQDYIEFSKEWLSECHRVLSMNGSFWVIGSMQCIYTIGNMMQEVGFWLINDVVWQKSNPTPNFLGTRLNNAHETLIWATKNKNSKYTFNYKTAKELNRDILGYEQGNRRQLGSVWKLPICSGNERLKDEGGNKIHSTQKPEALLYRIIAIASKMGDVVLDPFSGTLTTAAMAKRLGRNFIAMEREEKYIAFGKKRLENIEFENSEIAYASFDIKPKKVSLDDLIKNKFLYQGEYFYLKGKEDRALLVDNGRLMFNGEIYDIHTLAAKLRRVKTQRLNGFLYWEVKREGKRVLLNQVRDEFRKSL